MIDTFYVTDLVGQKIVNENRRATIVAQLKAVMNEDGEARHSMPSGILAPAGMSPGNTQKKARSDA